MLFNLEDLKLALGKNLVHVDENYNFAINNVVFDSREVTINTLFIAKKGERNDGHNFIGSVLEVHKDAVVLAERLPDGVEKNSRIILVDNTLSAFENLAIYARNRIRGHVIGITGSIGKTSTKDITYRVLSQYGKSFCSQQSFNGHIGVLTTLANTPADTEFAIFEMGVNCVGEMDVIRNLVNPEVAIILNIKPSHISCFQSEENIAIEKSKIVTKETKAVILNSGDKWFSFLNNRIGGQVDKIITFDITDKADIYLKKHGVNGDVAEVIYGVGGKEYSHGLKNVDHNVAFNAMAALALVKYFNLDAAEAMEAISSFDTTRGRNNIEYANYVHNGKPVSLTIINGSYNAVIPDAFIGGLKLMESIFSRGDNYRKVCLWGDMLETGDRADEFHLGLRKSVVKSRIDLLITVGDNMKKLNDSLWSASMVRIHFNDIYSLVNDIKNILRDKDLVFIKSSKGVKTYEVLNALVENKMKLFV
ncbi:UDP-N-acetylmuramoyl-tripeptide--D-alanyl-D-alanine ligase [Bacilli bacterium]|nr:UDP-N-acetylmuramoyl-tripeptide--D-alanyl-D-alanine ligase [Bacilli bacterium]